MIHRTQSRFFSANRKARRQSERPAMKLLFSIFFFALTANADVPQSFYNAIRSVEAGGREGNIIGDGGRALGPFQIHRAYWQDSRVTGSYGMVTNAAYSQRVVSAYLRRYCPQAVISGDFETMARVHNGGPRGASKKATAGYWQKVKAKL